MRRPQPSRRELMRVGLGGMAAISLSGTIPAFLSQFAYAQTMPSTQLSNDNVLVVIQFSGGNDGLNTVIPTRSDEYLKARPQLGLKNRLHTLDDALSLNPGMKVQGAFRQGTTRGCERLRLSAAQSFAL